MSLHDIYFSLKLWLILVHEFVTMEVGVVYVCVICSVQVNMCNIFVYVCYYGS
jgi:hypothetical protein